MLTTDEGITDIKELSEVYTALYDVDGNTYCLYYLHFPFKFEIFVSYVSAVDIPFIQGEQEKWQ